MRKSNSQSPKIPSASWIRQVIQEEVAKQLEERERSTKNHSESVDNSADSPINGWWMDDSDRSKSARVGSEDSQWDFWSGGDLLSEPLMGSIDGGSSRSHNVESSVAEEGLEASISPLTEAPMSRKTSSISRGARGKRR